MIAVRAEDQLPPLPDELTGHLDELFALCRLHHVTRLEVIGSAARGTFDPARSDFDFLVEFEELPGGEIAPNYFDFELALERLFGRRIDLVMPSAIRNRFFRKSIDAARRVLYAA